MLIRFSKRFEPILSDLIERELQIKKSSIKVQSRTWIKWRKEDLSNPEATIYVDKAFNSYMESIHSKNDISDVVEKMFIKMKEQIENPALPRSGFHY